MNDRTANATGAEQFDVLSEDIDRSPPIAFFLSAESFLQTAIYAHKATEAKALRLRFDMPLYYLYSHTMELTLKAFLRAKGVTAKQLANRQWGHDLLKLWEACFEHGLTLDMHAHLATGAVVDILAPYAASYEFRYVQIGYKILPTLDAVREAAEALQAAVKPVAVATVAELIPGRG